MWAEVSLQGGGGLIWLLASAQHQRIQLHSGNTPVNAALYGASHCEFYLSPYLSFNVVVAY